MSGLSVIWIWIALVVIALAINALILKSLFNRGKSVLHQLSRLAPRFENLGKQALERPKLTRPQSVINQDPSISMAKRLLLIKQRNQKQEQRQRRLLAGLKRKKATGSRFD